MAIGQRGIARQHNSSMPRDPTYRKETRVPEDV